MQKLTCAWKHAIAGLLGLVVSSTAWAQEPLVPTPMASGTPGLPETALPQPAGPVGGSSAGSNLNPSRSFMSSQPPPFTITPETPAASTNSNFFSGFAQVQDLSRLLPGNYTDTKYK